MHGVRTTSGAVGTPMLDLPYRPCEHKDAQGRVCGLVEPFVYRKMTGNTPHYFCKKHATGECHAVTGKEKHDAGGYPEASFRAAFCQWCFCIIGLAKDNAEQQGKRYHSWCLTQHNAGSMRT